MSSIGSGGPHSWQTTLWAAAGRADEAKIRELVQDGELLPSFGAKYEDGLSAALQKVVGRGHEPLTRFLLEKGADIKAGSLCKAAEQGRDKIVKLLLQHNADTEARDSSERTPIFLAAQKGHYQTLRLLLEAGADVNARDGNDQTVLLSLAAKKPDSKGSRWSSEILKLLLARGIDLEAKDKEGRTALLWAAATGKDTLAQLLLSSRAQENASLKAVNNRGKTALHLAAEHCRWAIAKLLCDAGADPQARSDGGWTPLHIAAERGDVAIASLLLSYRIDVNAGTSSGMTALHWASRNGHIEVVKLLLQQKSVRRAAKDSFDSTPMLGAAENGHIEIVKLLSPSNDGERLSNNAYGACKGFQATVVDFGMEHRPMNHHKHSVFDLLYGWDKKDDKPKISTLTRNVSGHPGFRWIHLPTNNMIWVEALMSKHFIENSARDVEGFKLLERSCAQAHRGPTIHSHFMRPQCQRFVPTARDAHGVNFSDVSAESNDKEKPSNATAVIDKVSTTIRGRNLSDKKQGPRKGEKLEKTPKSIPTNNAAKKAESFNTETSQKTMTKAPKMRERHGNIVLFMPYLHYETHEKRKEMSSTIKQATSKDTSPHNELIQHSSSDHMLIHAYLQSTHNLQIRRTLDQFYYHAISTDDRDEDQVVWRYTRDKGKEKKLFMVDQLWLWILDDLIITAFPQRWKQPKNDPLNVLDGIIEDASSKTRPPIKSVYELAVLITGRCIGVFDRHSIHDGDYQFLDMFESSIGEVMPVQTNRETQLFKRFNDASIVAARVLRDSRQRRKAQIGRPHSEGDSEENPLFVDTLLDIGEETALLAETKDIKDELNMLSMVLTHQDSILQDLEPAILCEFRCSHYQQKQADAKKRIREQRRLIEVHLKDVERMDKQAEGIYTSLTHLLDLKQKHANAIEARFARDQAVFTGRQGQTIMVFTIVTVIFLPMSFIAAVFTIPISEFPRVDGTASLPFPYVAKFVLGVGLAISIPLIAVAFAVDSISLFCGQSLRTLFAGKGSKRAQHNDVGPSTRDKGRDDHLLGDVAEKTYANQPSFETEDRSRVSTPSKEDVRHRAEGGWRQGPELRARTSGGSDLERGIHVSMCQM